MDVLRGSGRTAGLSGGGGVRNAVAIAEVALSFVLLIGSGLMVRSFIALQHVDLGLDPHNLLTIELLGGRGGQQPQARAARLREIQTRLSEIGGVETVRAALVVGQGLWLSATGIGIGLMAASAVTRVMASMLVGVRATDPATFIAIVGSFS
jgi:hypothetical protein